MAFILQQFLTTIKKIILLIIYLLLHIFSANRKYFCKRVWTFLKKRNSFDLLNSSDNSTEQFYIAKVLLTFNVKTPGTEHVGQNSFVRYMECTEQLNSFDEQ